MLVLALLLFAASVPTVLYWAAVVALVYLILGTIWLTLKAVWWMITRSFVCHIIQPLKFIFGIQTENGAAATLPTRPEIVPPTPSGLSRRISHLTKLQSLKDSGAITPDEFDRMKHQVFADADNG